MALIFLGAGFKPLIDLRDSVAISSSVLGKYDLSRARQHATLAAAGSDQP
jgi:hypothetical protein